MGKEKRLRVVLVTSAKTSAYLNQLGLWPVAEGGEGLQAVRNLRGLEEGQLAV